MQRVEKLFGDAQIKISSVPTDIHLVSWAKFCPQTRNQPTDTKAQVTHVGASTRSEPSP
jgi:hypothetical protein